MNNYFIHTHKTEQSVLIKEIKHRNLTPSSLGFREIEIKKNVTQKKSVFSNQAENQKKTNLRIRNGGIQEKQLNYNITPYSLRDIDE